MSGVFSAVAAWNGVGGAARVPEEALISLMRALERPLSPSFDLPAAARATYTARCRVRSDASGLLVNTAKIEPGADVDPNNNRSSDRDTQLVPRADLRTTKTRSRYSPERGIDNTRFGDQ